MRVLVVEDEARCRSSWRAALGEAGYAVDCAADGERADFLGQTERYDAVVLDLGLPKVDGLTVLRRWRDAGHRDPGAGADGARQLAREGPGHRRRRRRLRRQAVPDRGSAGAAARADPPRERTGDAGAALRRPRARSARREGHRRRRAGQADQPRVPRALVPDAPARPRRVAGRADRAHLRAELRSRLEHGRGVHRAAAAQARRLVHRDGARPRLSHRGASHDVGRGRSARRADLSASLLWIVGLLADHDRRSRSALIHRVSRICVGFVHNARAHASSRRSAWSAGCRWCGSGLSPFDELRERLPPCATAATPRSTGEYPTEVQPLVDDLNALLEHRDRRVTRAIAKAGDLAHGLKTPLAVLAQEAERADAAGQAELAAVMRQQVERMRRQMDYHLAHARAAASGATLRARVPGARRRPTAWRARCCGCTPIAGSRSTSTCPPSTSSAAEREDLDEMLGNLLDNACKWARSRVTIDVGRRRRAPSSSPWTTTGRGWIRRCGTRCCSAACAPTKRRRAPASASRSSAIWPSSTADRSRWGTSSAGGLPRRLQLPS